MGKRDLEVTEVAAGVYRYGTDYINCYLIEDKGRLTLLDTGLPRYIRHLRSALAHIGRSITDIDAILLTHCHVDHIGCAKRVRQESNAPVFIHETEVPDIVGDRKPGIPKLGTKITRPYLLRYLMHLVPNGAARYPAVAEVRSFGDGEVLEVPGSPRVIHAPGHTQGSSALVMDDRRILFSGDALVTLDTLGGGRGPHVFTPPFTVDYQQAVRSLDALADVQADVMLPGHGEPWRGSVAEAVTIARSRAQP